MAKRGKKVTNVIKLQAPGGQATPAPPVGPALGQHGLNIGQFVQQFNAQTASLNGMPVTVVVSVYADRSFTFEVKIAKGSGVSKKEEVGTVTREQLRDIGERKLPDLNCLTLEAAVRMIEGTARSMGIEVVD